MRTPGTLFTAVFSFFFSDTCDGVFPPLKMKSVVYVVVVVAVVIVVVVVAVDVVVVVIVFKVAGRVGIGYY